jgi:hypothetical protein
VDAADRKLNELMVTLEAAPSKALGLRVQQLETEVETMRAELLSKEATQKATTPPSVAYDKFASELAEHLNEPEYRERVKTALRGIIDHIQFSDKSTFCVYFKGGQHVTVGMGNGTFDWQHAVSVGAALKMP